MDNQNILRETKWGRIFLGPNPNSTEKTPHNRALTLGTGEKGASDRETSVQRESLNEISNSQSTAAISPRSSTPPPLFVPEVPTQSTGGPVAGYSSNTRSPSPAPSSLNQNDLPQSNTVQDTNLINERLNFLLFKDAAKNLAKVTYICTSFIEKLERSNVRLDEADSKLTSLEASNEIAKYSQETLEAQSKSIRTNLESLVTNFKKLKNHVVSLIYCLQRIEKQTKKVKDDSLEFKNDNADLKRTVDEVKQVSKEMNQVKGNWDMNMQDIQGFIHIVDSLKTDMGQQEQNGNKLKEIVIELKNEMEHFKKHNLELNVNVSEINKCVAAQEQTLTKVENKIDDLKDDVINKFNEHKGNQDEIKKSVNELGAEMGTRLGQQKDEDETSLNFMRNMVHHLGSKFSEQQDRDRRLQTEVAELNEEIKFCKTTSTKVAGILDTVGEKLEKLAEVGNHANPPAADQINHIYERPLQRPGSSCSSISYKTCNTPNRLTDDSDSDSSDLYFDAENLANVIGSAEETPSGSPITSNSSTADSNITAAVVVPTRSTQQPKRNAVRMVRRSSATATTSKSNEERNSFHREDKTKRVNPSQTKPRNTRGSNIQTKRKVTKKATFSSTTASRASKRKLDESDSDDSDDSSADEDSEDEWKPYGLPTRNKKAKRGRPALRR